MGKAEPGKGRGVVGAGKGVAGQASAGTLLSQGKLYMAR